MNISQSRVHFPCHFVMKYVEAKRCGGPWAINFTDEKDVGLFSLATCTLLVSKEARKSFRPINV